MRRERGDRLDDPERMLVGEMYPSLLRFASVVRPPGLDGNDLVQEAFLRFIRTGRSLTEMERPAAYLRKTILHLSMDHQRSERRRRRAWAKLDPEPSGTPTYSWDLDELRLVAPKARAVLYLRIIEGWPFEDIARMLGCSQASARVAATRGRRELESVLSKEVADAAT